MAMMATQNGLCIDVVDDKTNPVISTASMKDGTLAFLCNLDKLWSNTGADKTIVLHVYFMNEHAKEEDILHWMDEWSEHCGVIFKKTTYINKSQIRVDFQKGFSRTRIGTNADEWPRDWTMNLGTVDRPTVLHETGHALGLLHEHQSPFSPEPIFWNESQIIKDVRSYGWTEDDIRRNITDKYSCGDTYGGVYDPDTIMKYSIPPNWIKPETKNKDDLMKRNTELSQMDKKLISLLYPKPNLTRAREHQQDLPLHQLPLSIVRPHRAHHDRIEADSTEVRPIPAVRPIPTAGDNILQRHLKMKHLNEILPYVKNIGDEDLRRLGLSLGLLFPTLKRMRNLPEDLTGAWLNREENVLETSGEPTYETLAVAMEEIGQTGMAQDVRNQRHAKQKK